MRISDWSSDVCSSDLDRQKFDFVGIGGTGDRIGAQQRPPLARQADHHELARTEAEARRAADREAEQMLVPVAHRTHLLDGQRGGGRSEEHTSELQSLMRISYAVFCLKKKKYNKSKNTKYTDRHNE